MKLTNEQIKQTGLAMIAFSEGKKVEAAFVQSPNSWHDVERPNWHNEAAIFRPKPQPVSRPWSKPEDVPLNCWFRTRKGEPERLVTMVASNGIRIAGISHDSAFFEWRELSALEHSTDRVTWKPCTVEE
jgi:hypothetical protein